jgi:N-acetyl-alpha-D-muramate 1-phosphate uridylyltransferase
MRALILAAGRGKRMGELTNHRPKPLLRINDYYLIEYAIARLRQAGIREIVINLFYLGDAIKTALGNGERYGMAFAYSEEQQCLEVGGGLLQALSLLGPEPFIALSSDVICDYPLARLPKAPKSLAHLVLVDNPDFNPAGDFGIEDGYLNQNTCPKFNFAGIAVYRPELFAGLSPGFYQWGSILLPAIKNHQVSGEYYQGIWHNIGTEKELQAAKQDPELSKLADIPSVCK